LTYRFALRPRWLVGHVVVLLLVGVMVSLAFWQLRRLDERREANAAVLRGARENVALDVALSPAAESVGDAVYRRVTVRGTFDERNELLVRFRTSDGLPGYDVVTPLVTQPGVAVLVNRGWRPLEVDTGPPHQGEVTVTGLLRADEGKPVRLAREESHAVVSALDSAKLASVVGYDLYPGWLQLSRPDDPSSFPKPLPSPDPGEGPHFTYALQWLAFSIIAVVGWFFLVRSSARRRSPVLGG
jgi:cytochrome oxidase assembly protein ShyY1